MKLNQRIIIAVIVLLVLVGAVLGVDAWQRRKAASEAPANMPPGSIPIFLDGQFTASFVPDDLEQIQTASFVDAEEGKTQEGWLLRELLLLYVDPAVLQDGTLVTVSSSSREKTVTARWAEIQNPDNTFLFDLSSRGTLKLASQMPGFDTRDAWVQDVDKIEVEVP